MKTDDTTQTNTTVWIIAAVALSVSFLGMVVSMPLALAVTGLDALSPAARTSLACLYIVCIGYCILRFNFFDVLIAFGLLLLMAINMGVILQATELDIDKPLLVISEMYAVTVRNTFTAFLHLIPFLFFGGRYWGERFNKKNDSPTTKLT